MPHWIVPKSCCAAVFAALIGLGAQPCALAQEEAPPASKGENFSAKPPAQLFASDCTGAGCHKSPQGLAKNSGIGLAGFLREHYTNSRESAAAIAAYLTKLPGAPESKEARKPRSGKLPPESPAASVPGWFESVRGQIAAPAKPAPKEKEERTSRQHPNARTSRTAARPEEPAFGPIQRHELEHDTPRPATRERAQRNRHPAATAAAPPESSAEPTPAPETPAPSVAAAPAEAATPVPAAAPAPPAPPKKQYNIFD